MEADLTLTQHEAGIVKQWSEKTISGGHWGDGDVVFPDEVSVLEKLKRVKAGEAPMLTVRDVEIMLVWMEAHCGSITGGLSLTHDEAQLVRKLRVVCPKE